MDVAPWKTSKGRLPIALLAVIVVVTCLVGGFILYISAKVEWRDAPVFSEAKNVKTQLSSNGSVRTTTFTVYKEAVYTKLNYFTELREMEWGGPNNGLTNPLFTFTDRSKNIVIDGFNYLYINKCIAFYLQTNFESVAEEETKVTIVQTVGPCGKPLS